MCRTCLLIQVLSLDALFLFDPCGEYLFTGADPQTTTTATASDGLPPEHRQQRGGTASSASHRTRRPSSASPSSASPSRTPSPSSSFTIHNASPGSNTAASATTPPSGGTGTGTGGQQIARPRSAFSSSASGVAVPHRPITGVGGGGGGASGRRASGGGGRRRTTPPRREPIGRSYVVTREDVLNQFPHQVSVGERKSMRGAQVLCVVVCIASYVVICSVLFYFVVWR